METSNERHEHSGVSEAYAAIGGLLVMITCIATFIAAYVYCVLTYGFLWGLGLGWLPSAIFAVIVNGACLAAHTLRRAIDCWGAIPHVVVGLCCDCRRRVAASGRHRNSDTGCKMDRNEEMNRFATKYNMDFFALTRDQRREWRFALATGAMPPPPFSLDEILWAQECAGC
jgi:hypothetical protein